jgi:hypothetical protein
MHNREEALTWCGWCLEHVALPEKRKRLYRLLRTLLGFHLSGDTVADYGRSLRLFYREEEIYQAEAVIDGTSSFPGLDFAGTWREISAEQEKLLSIYRRVNRLKISPRISPLV